MRHAQDVLSLAHVLIMILIIFTPELKSETHSASILLFWTPCPSSTCSGQGPSGVSVVTGDHVVFLCRGGTSSGHRIVESGSLFYCHSALTHCPTLANSLHPQAPVSLMSVGWGIEVDSLGILVVTGLKP